MTWQRVVRKAGGVWYCWYSPADQPPSDMGPGNGEFVYHKSLKIAIRKSHSIKPEGVVLFTYLER